MNTIDEELWSYIDGTCTLKEQVSITKLIRINKEYQQKYQELLELNQEIAGISLDEPSMAFTYNVMEGIRTENARQPLKAAIDQRVIWGISIFFAFTIIALLIFTIANTSFSGFKINVNLLESYNMPNVGSIFKSPIFKWFLIFDVMLALFLTDSYLRKKYFTPRA